VNLLPMGFVVFMVVGLILMGIATPTESAAFGVLSIVILMAAFRVLTYEALQAALLSTVKVGGMVFFIILNSSIFSQLLAYSGASSGMLRFVVSFDLNATIGVGADLLCAAVSGHVHGPGVDDPDHHARSSFRWRRRWGSIRCGLASLC
jgi:TRAP-type C4-dicarboxylate transport system permease large subunit